MSEESGPSKVFYNTDFVSVGCNRISNCASWGVNNFVAYAAHKFIGIYDPINIKLLRTIPAHSERVNCVIWLPSTIDGVEEETELASSSVDKTIKIWKNEGDNKFTLTATLEGHEDSVTSISAVLDTDGKSILLVSSSADSSIKIWRRDHSTLTWDLLQTLKLGADLVETIALTSTPDSNLPIFAFGSVDHTIRIYISDENMKFYEVGRLSGHEDWIRCLSFVTTENGELILASGSQDKRIRLWRFTKVSDKNINKPKKLDPSALLSTLYETEEGDVLDLSEHGTVITTKDGSNWNIVLESVILGHEDRVFSVNWIPKIVDPNTSKKIQPMRFLSASMDRSMVIWEPDVDTGVWIEVARVGEVGGNHLGFYGGLYGKDGKYILGHSYNGAFHMWEQEINEFGDEVWNPYPTISGHFDQVMDICWDPAQNYFVSVSKDQTARLWSLWKKDSGSAEWHEIGRPQIHGHDLSCIAFQRGVSHRYISGAEEKVLRVFDAPRSFLESLKNLSSVEYTDSQLKERAATSNVPALGLSNKPIFDDTTQTEKNLAETVYEEIHGDNPYGGDFNINDKTIHAPLVLVNRPPYEDQLRQRLLWPETHKLYGHGNELYCITSNHKGDLLASSCTCKTQNQNQAGIKIWDTNDWKEVNELSGHVLTVTSLEFSPNDKYLMSASRGRSLCIHKRIDSTHNFDLVFSNSKAHLRIIWSTSWSHDSRLIATGSRDKTIKIWKINEEPFQCNLIDTMKFKHPITAVSWAPEVDPNHYYLAVGLESGEIQLWKISEKDSNISKTLALEISKDDCHVETIRKLIWGKVCNNVIPLLSCSTDNSIRLYSITISADQ